ncbi:nucleotidyltransferase family protein [Labilibacter sediminis]|nr:nucleotidyltransferase family protein [Labilibacter sediminis]
MNALIFAAGLGTRLLHITEDKPKALIEVAGKPMLFHAIEKLVAAGITRIVINVHHHAHMIQSYIRSLQFSNVEILISDEREMLLETGGGLLNAKHLFIKDKPVILYNADVLTGINLKNMIEFHEKNKGIATLMVKDRPTSRYFIFDDHMRLSGWTNISTGDKRITRQCDTQKLYAFSGIHIVNYSILNMLGGVRKFSITNGYLDISGTNAIYGWKDWNEHWFDIGTPEKLAEANKFYENIK